jgi:hypothetical protein
MAKLEVPANDSENWKLGLDWTLYHSRGVSNSSTITVDLG